MCNEDDASSSPDRGRERKRLPIVCVERPRCPKCSSPLHRKYRSVTNAGDDTAMWWVRCTECQQRFKVVLE